MIEVLNVSKSYKKKQVLDQISFHASCGEQIAIAGRNGCGKTTLMKILAGIEKADQGSVLCFGQDILKCRDQAGRFCGFVPQENPLIPELSVRDNISLWSGTRGLPEERLMQMFELEPILHTPVKKLSGGMKRRVAIACALVDWPPVVIMDEPTSALDTYYRDLIHDWMKQYRDMNGILIIATHDEWEKRQSDRCLHIVNGRLEENENEREI